MIRFCPNCQSERPISEFFCEGTIDGRRCSWNLTEIPFHPEGWRPTPIVPTISAEPPVEHTCPNGHAMEPGDLLCIVCGEGPIAIGNESGESASPIPNPVDPSTVTVIGGWRVLREIGGVSQFLDRYEVESEAEQRAAILTLYRHGIEPDPAIYTALSRIAREHVVQILDTGRWNDRAFEVEELVSGGDFSEFKILPTDLTTLQLIVSSVGKCLNAISQVGLRHRDIRPETIFIREKDPLVLALGGFGSARLSESDLDIASPLSITKYSAPETIAGGVTPASDWWSLGMVLLEKVTSGAEFSGIHQQAFLIHVLANGAPIPPGLSPELDVLLRGLLALDRHQRWQWQEVSAWLSGEFVPAPEPAQLGTDSGSEHSISLGGKRYTTAHSYALAAAESENWEEAKDQLLRGSVVTWVEGANFGQAHIAGLRRVIGLEVLSEDSRTLLALKALNPNIPLIWKGDIVTPRWLLDNPVEGYELISGLIPDILNDLHVQDNWLSRMKSRCENVRVRANNLGIDLDEAILRINLLSTSRAKLVAEWQERRKYFPDSDHLGVLGLIERRSVSEEDLIVLLSASLSQFRSRDAILQEATTLAQELAVHEFNLSQAEQTIALTRGEIFLAVSKLIEGFAQCSYSPINAWVDEFRLTRKISLARALVVLAIPPTAWSTPQRQQYVSQLLDFFERKVVASVMRGPLVRMVIGKTTPRVDVVELGTALSPAAGILNHILMRNSLAIPIDPEAFRNPQSTTEARLQRLGREAQLYKRETGIDGLFLGFPFIVARDGRSGSSARIAPLLLWPIRFHHDVGTRGSGTIAFDKDREEIRINPAIDGILGADTATQWRQIADELLSRSAIQASDVIHAFGTLATVRSETISALPNSKVTIQPRTIEICCSAVLFLMTFMGQAIGEDLRRLKSCPPGGTALERALRLPRESTENSESIPALREHDRYLVVSSDPSQEEVIQQSGSGVGLLIEGPPGTGKSQTIVNLVADAIGHGRSLLIVCQKHAALEVVHKRLVAEGLQERVILVNDESRDRESIIGAIREQVTSLHRRLVDPSIAIRNERNQIAARIESLEGALDRHHEELHRTNDKFGLSYRQLLGDLIRLDDSELKIDVPALRVVLEPLNTVELALLEEEIAPLARYWLPARYENSALHVLQAFSSDKPTVDEFVSNFNSFATAEQSRTAVLLTRRIEFEIDDPVPHRTWLDAYGNELLTLTDEQRQQLTRWLPLFRTMDSDVAIGESLLRDLEEVTNMLENYPKQHWDNRLSPNIATLPDRQLIKLQSSAMEAQKAVGALSRLNPLRALKVRKSTTFLRKRSDSVERHRLAALVLAIQLELAWRPLREKLNSICMRLELGTVDADAGLALPPYAQECLTSLRKVANIASSLELAPLQDRIERAIYKKTHDAILTLYAEYDAAFARCAARIASNAALQKISTYLKPDWIDSCKINIANNTQNIDRIQPILDAIGTVAAYQEYRGRAKPLTDLAVAAFSTLREKQIELDTVDPLNLNEAIRQIVSREARLAWKRQIEIECPDLQLDREEIKAKVASLEALDREIRVLNSRFLQENFDMDSIRPPRQWEDINRLRGQRARRLREFVEQGIGLGLLKLRPIWLMNPDVASRVLPLRAGTFDMVVFDEASQLPVEFAIPTLYRGRICVISGDEKQMPPSSFFSARMESDEADEFDDEIPPEDASPEELATFDETWSRREIKDCPDLLQLGRSSLPIRRLQVHYRSEYRELIGFSNAAYYGGDLNIPVRHPETTVKAAKPIEVEIVDGIYVDQTNPQEAERVVEILAEIWREPYDSRPSIGIVTFNRKQADLIEEEIELRAESDPSFREAFRLENERTLDGEDMSVFVKNVENVQGDERDIIIFSSTFGRNKNGGFLRNFGVLGQVGGERRLNVAITRARKKVIMITSMPIAEISDALATHRPLQRPRDYLQGYLEYARNISDGNFEASRALLQRWTPAGSNVHSARGGMNTDGFSRAVSDFIRSLGYDPKQSMEDDVFGVDFAIEHPSTGLFAIGIECDAPKAQLLRRARSREVWRPSVLRRSIPVIHRVSSRDWYHNTNEEKFRLRKAIEISTGERD